MKRIKEIKGATRPHLQPDLLVIGQATIDDINREGEGLVAERIPGGDSIAIGPTSRSALVLMR